MQPTRHGSSQAVSNHFNAACIDRELLALVIFPKFELPSVVFGVPSCDVFHALKAFPPE